MGRQTTPSSTLESLRSQRSSEEILTPGQAGRCDCHLSPEKFPERCYIASGRSLTEATQRRLRDPSKLSPKTNPLHDATKAPSKTRGPHEHRLARLSENEQPFPKPNVSTRFTTPVGNAVGTSVFEKTKDSKAANHTVAVERKHPQVMQQQCIDSDWLFHLPMK